MRRYMAKKLHPQYFVEAGDRFSCGRWEQQLHDINPAQILSQFSAKLGLFWRFDDKLTF
jgi:hypothetical protein